MKISQHFELKSMIKTKYLLYSFKSQTNTKYQYWYKTNNKYFTAEKPPASILKSIRDEASQPSEKEIIDNPLSKSGLEYLLRPFKIPCQ